MEERRRILLGREEDATISQANIDIPISSLEGYFVFDLVQNSMIRQKGIARLFGYQGDDIDLSFILDHLHPEDARDVNAILKEVFSQLIHAKIPAGCSYLKISFHLVSREGEKLGILSDNIVFSNDREGKPVSVLVKFVKADFIGSSTRVDWWVDSRFLDWQRIEQALDPGKSELFTPRELQVIQLIHSDLNSARIAEELCLSEHTVITHKKNIFAKSGCHSVEELKQFCLRERIF